MPYFQIQIPALQHSGYTSAELMFVHGVERTHTITVPLPFYPTWLAAQRFFLSHGAFGAYFSVKMRSSYQESQIYTREVSSLSFDVSGDGFSLTMCIVDADGPDPHRLRVFCTLAGEYEISTDIAAYTPSCERYEVFYAEDESLTLKCGDKARQLRFFGNLALISSINNNRYCIVARAAQKRQSASPVFQIQASGAKFFLFTPKKLADAVFLRLENERVEQALQNVQIVSDSQKCVLFDAYTPNLFLYTFPTFSAIDLTEIIVNGTNGTWQLRGCSLQFDFYKQKTVRFLQNVRKRSENTSKAIQTAYESAVVVLPEFVSIVDLWKGEPPQNAVNFDGSHEITESSTIYRPLGISAAESGESRVESTKRSFNKSVISEIDKTMEILGQKTRMMDSNLRKLQSFK